MSLKENDTYEEQKLERASECEYCGGEGRVEVMERDADSHEYAPVGTQICICQVDDMEVEERDR